MQRPIRISMPTILIDTVRVFTREILTRIDYGEIKKKGQTRICPFVTLNAAEDGG
jgi:hypothetical protein